MDKERDVLLSITNLEVSKTILGEMITAPNAITQIELVNKVWKETNHHIQKPRVSKLIYI